MFDTGWKPAPSDLGSFEEASDLGFFLICEMYVERAPIFLQVLDFLRPRNGENITTLFKKPNEGQLRRGTALPVCECLELVHELNIGVAILTLKSWEVRFAEVFWIVGDLAIAEGCSE